MPPQNARRRETGRRAGPKPQILGQCWSLARPRPGRLSQGSGRGQRAAAGSRKARDEDCTQRGSREHKMRDGGRWGARGVDSLDNDLSMPCSFHRHQESQTTTGSCLAWTEPRAASALWLGRRQRMAPSEHCRGRCCRDGCFDPIILRRKSSFSSRASQVETMKLALVISAVIAALSSDPGAFAEPPATALIYAGTLRPSHPTMQRPPLTKTSGPSIVMTLTKKMRAHRSSPTSNSKDAGAVDDAEEGAAEAEAGVEEGVGGADHSVPAVEGVSAAAADSVEVAASAGDEASADVAGASGDPGGASTAASIGQTAQCVRAKTAPPTDEDLGLYLSATPSSISDVPMNDPSDEGEHDDYGDYDNEPDYFDDEFDDDDFEDSDMDDSIDEPQDMTKPAAVSLQDAQKDTTDDYYYDEPNDKDFN
ncbi:hypothetical protein THAOC_22427 [Thalassiosira oceanica]|uniref:Uncharacterized protein n=2 Tax=Thalassiosira oceanica TaxID=159749 RepID=K0RYG1_THAOC|nr:hypothetical protein THAOC_22427 [Thalassiosira oceanica]|eukprot:EJK57519.1 hypothetical protein THAOC_22427 [Thalassiosira oceanica]